MNRLLLSMSIAACTPGTGFDDLPPTADKPPADDTPDGDTDTDADSDADADGDTDGDTDTDETADTGLPPIGTGVINEVLSDPPTDLAGDTNCDGAADPIADDFVEIVNTGDLPLDLGEAVLVGLAGVAHTFPAGLVLDPGHTVVVFGGGTPTFDGTATSGPWCLVLPPEITLLVSSGGDLGLASTGDTLTLTDRFGRVVDTATWGAEGDADQSLNRDPELTGALVQHTALAGAVGAFSPGTFADGTPIVLPSEDTGNTGDTSDTSDTGVPSIAVVAAIDEVQTGIHPVGTEVQVTGVVTAIGTDGVCMELPAGGPNSGVLVHLGAGFEATWGAIAEGDTVVVVGQVQEPAGNTTIDVVASSAPSVTVTSAGDVPPPFVLTAPALAADPEPWEGVLVELVDLVVTDPLTAGNTFEVADLAGTAVFQVDDQLALYSGYSSLLDGDRFTAIRGPLSSMNGDYRIEPRRDEDLMPAALPTLRINEILADPPPTLGDANCDGLVDPDGDDFVELWNIGAATADLTGMTLSDAVGIRHRFPAGTVVDAGAAITVFDGGIPTFDGSGIAGTWCTVAIGSQTASSGSLGLTSTGDTVTVASGSRVIETAVFGPEANGATSINRDPDRSLNALVPHPLVFGAVNVLSPGTSVDGVPSPYRAVIGVDGDPNEFPVDSAFVTSSGAIGRIAWDATRLYLSVTDPAIALGADQWLIVYLGVGAGGTTTGFPIGIQQPVLPFPASVAVRWAADGTADGLLVWDGAAWAETPDWLGTGGSSVADDDGLQTVELAIPFAAVDVETAVDVVVALVSDTPGSEITFGAIPSTTIPNGVTDPDYTVYFHFTPNLDTPPSAYSPVP